MSLPTIDFASIAATAKAAMAAYGTSVEFFEQGSTTGRSIKAVIYNDGATTLQLIGDATESTAKAILNPDDFLSPYRDPRRFDTIKITVGGFSRTYTIESVSPITAQDTLPLLLANLKAN